MIDALDVVLSFVWLAALAFAIVAAWRLPKRPRHVWGEIGSTDIASAERRRWRR